MVGSLVFWPNTRHDGNSSPTRRTSRGTPVVGDGWVVGTKTDTHKYKDPGVKY